MMRSFVRNTRNSTQIRFSESIELLIKTI